MTIIFCVDDRFGLLFNHRRQSSDRILRGYILSLCREGRLLMSGYSARQFELDGMLPSFVQISEDMVADAKEGDFCFAEAPLPLSFLRRASRILLYKWNRTYPFDCSLEAEAVLHGRELISVTDLVGSSHDKITEEVYA